MAVEKFPIEAGHIMMFARSIGDANPIYYDDAYAATTEPGGVVAPPTFVQASAQFDPDYFLRPKIGQEWFGSAKGPTGITEKKRWRWRWRWRRPSCRAALRLSQAIEGWRHTDRHGQTRQ